MHRELSRGRGAALALQQALREAISEESHGRPSAWRAVALLTNQAFPGFYAGDHFGTFNWWMRLLTGMLAAWGLPAFFFPWLDQLFREEVTPQAKQSASRS